MQDFGIGKKKEPEKLEKASLMDVLTKGMGRSFIPESQKKVIADALVKAKGASLAGSYLRQPQDIIRLKEAMRVLEKAGVFKPYQGTGILESYKTQQEILRKNLKETIKEDMQRDMAKRMLSGEEAGGNLNEAQKRILIRRLSPREVAEIQKNKLAVQKKADSAVKNKIGQGRQKISVIKQAPKPPRISLSR